MFWVALILLPLVEQVYVKRHRDFANSHDLPPCGRHARPENTPALRMLRTFRGRGAVLKRSASSAASLRRPHDWMPSLAGIGGRVVDRCQPCDSAPFVARCRTLPIDPSPFSLPTPPFG